MKIPVVDRIVQRGRLIPPLVWVLLLTTLCLAPFATRAFHIDDTLFLRVAEQIHKKPADFYGFHMNWYGTVRPMTENLQNPPLSCFYLAAVAAVIGWSEVALHLSYLLPALALVWGIYTLANFFCQRPVRAALIALLTPVFLISAATVMCDVMMLAFWVWAVVFFERGLRSGTATGYLAAGTLCGLAFLTKFTGIALIPLLAAYGLCRKRRLGSWLSAVLLPILIVGGYEWITHQLYGSGLLLKAVGISSHAAASVGGGFIEKQVLGLSYVGGCLLPVLFLVPWLWTGRNILAGLLAIMPLLLFYPRLGSYALLWRPDGSTDWLLCLQSALFIVSGLHVLILAASDWWSRREAVSVLLLLWVFGIFVFATACNWTVNGRTILPMLPAVAILAARRLDLKIGPEPSRWSRAVVWPQVVAGAMSILLAASDSALANSARSASKDLCAAYQHPGKTLWFEGHWGFQYYMERAGARALEVGTLEPALGDFVVVPSEAVNTFDIPTNLVRLVTTHAYTPNRYCSTMSHSAGAGFYAATAGPFPFSAGEIEPECYYVFEVTQPKGTATFGPMSPFSTGAVRKQFALQRKKKSGAQP